MKLYNHSIYSVWYARLNGTFVQHDMLFKTPAKKGRVAELVQQEVWDLLQKGVHFLQVSYAVLPLKPVYKRKGSPFG